MDSVLDFPGTHLSVLLSLTQRSLLHLKPYIPKYEEYRSLSNYLNRLKVIHAASNRINIEWGDPVDHLIRQRYRNGGYTPFIGINAYGQLTISPYLPLTVGDLKKHTLLDYWKNGLAIVWSLDIVREISAMIKSSDRLGFSNVVDKSVPKTYFENSISIDLIDDSIRPMERKCN